MEHIVAGGRSIRLLAELNRDRILAVLVIIGSILVAARLLGVFLSTPTGV